MPPSKLPYDFVPAFIENITDLNGMVASNDVVFEIFFVFCNE